MSTGGDPPTGAVDFGDLRRRSPISPDWGFSRGAPLDRHYIERFLAAHRADVRGAVLEVEDSAYTRRCGGLNVTHSDVLHVTPGHPGATVIADLADAPHLPADRYDCVILTQTLQYVYDLAAAVATVHRILRPGGVVLATLPGLSRTSDPAWPDRWFWSFTSRSARRLFAQAFGADSVAVEGHGNLLVATAFLHGLAQEDLGAGDLDPADEGFEIVIAVRAVK